MKTCFLFPGQGAQYPGMGKDFYDASSDVQKLFELASEITSKDLKKLLFEGSEEDLKKTDNTQIAITLVNCSASLYLKEKGIEADGAAGFSLGEYAALWEAGVMKTEELFTIVKARGELMEKASRNLDSADGQAGMAAVLGMTYDEVLDVIKSMDGEQIYPANYNSPTQTVISGTASALDKGEKAFSEAMKYVRLKVSGPFHCPLLKEARDGLEEVLKGFTFSDPVKSVYANVTGKRIETGIQAKELAVEQVIAPVLWVDEEESILADGYERLIETGPGRVLGGLWKSFNKEIKVKKGGTIDDVAALLDA